MKDEYAQAEARLTARGFTRMVFDLSRVEALLDLLGSPQRAYPAIHITGTNGKTSTARMIDALLRAHGLRVGCYTSPHLAGVRERISIDGAPVSADVFVEIYREVEPVAQFLDEKNGQAQTLTYFDLTTAMALAAFADAPVDVAVVEVGLGGAEDSTNVLQASTCVVTPIGLDHTQWLGETVEEIATAKAGIVHHAATVVCATQLDQAFVPLVRRCAEVDASILYEGRDFGVIARRLAVGGQLITLGGLGGAYDDMFLPLHGAHQAQNAAVALAAVEAFLGAGASTRQLDPEVIRAGFASASSPGRLERVRTSPTILLDAAHNPAGMAAMADAVRDEFVFGRLVGVLAVLADKDVPAMVEILEPILDVVVCTRNTSPRAMSPRDLAGIAAEIFGEHRVYVAQSMPDAIEMAVMAAETPAEVELSAVGVLVTGSVVTVADARTLLVR